MVHRTTETDWKSLYEAETRICARQAAEIVQLRAQVEELKGDGETVPVPKAALDWLFGEGKDKDGWGFGECRTAQLALNAKNPRRYWWRSKLRAMIPALSHKHAYTNGQP